MNTKTLTRNPNQRGYTLMEILVAVSIFAVIILVALLLYDRSNQVFKQSVEASDMQQSTRVAFDKLAADLRMAGFDYDRDGTPFGALANTWTKSTTFTSGMLVQPSNPNGHTYICITGGTSDASEPLWPTGDKEQVKDGATVVWEEAGQLQYQQPDEQIEYAGRSAVVIRANFNYETAKGPCVGVTPCEGGREPNLQSAEFPVVTTSNQEIVAYALKPVKWASGESADSLVFYADTSIPRKANPTTDAKENKITISGVDLCDAGCNSPPYTLYRYTIQDNGTPDAGTPVAENIREVVYKYYTTTAAATDDEIDPLPNGDGQYDGGSPDAIVDGRDTRASIRAVELSLVGMNPQPDYNYTDAADSKATNYRKLELKSLITPRNAGRRGMKEYSTDPPEAPELQSICTGACNAVFLTWKAPVKGGDIESYSILYDTEKCQGDAMPTGGYQYSEEVGLNLSGSVGRFIVPNTGYSFAVQAVSKWGAKASKCMWVDKVLNKTKPKALEVFEASGPAQTDPMFAVQPNQIDLFFPAAGLNVSGEDLLSCEGGGNLQQTNMPPAEKRYYEVWRGTKATFQPEDTGAVLVLNSGTVPQPAAFGDYLKWSDLTAANCIDYYYRIRVIDHCAQKDEWNESGDAESAKSEWFPALGDDAISGRAENYAHKPLKPSLALAKEDCTGANCTLTLSWNAITKNTNNEAIAVDTYTLYAFQSSDGVTFPTTATDKKDVTGGVLNTTYAVKKTDLWKFTLTAKDCNESEPSEPLVYPCVFNAGSLTADVTAGEYGGTGAIGDPYIVEDATVTAVTTSDVSEFRMAVIDTSNESQVATATKTGTAKTADFSLPANLPDGKLLRVEITAVDDKGCTKITYLYVRDEAAPSCSITDAGTDATIVNIQKDHIIYTLKNTSNLDLTIEKVVVNYSSAIGKVMSKVTYDGTAVNTNCLLTTSTTTPPSGKETLAKNSSTYQLRLDFTEGNMKGANPTISLCIIYRTPTGDLLGCQIFPKAATCTAPGSTCQ